MTPTETADRRRWMALVVLCVGMLMIVLDVTVVNVALPSIQDDLGFSQSGLAWVVNAYLVAFGGLLLLAGRIGDRAQMAGGSRGCDVEQDSPAGAGRRRSPAVPQGRGRDRQAPPRPGVRR